MLLLAQLQIPSDLNLLGLVPIIVLGLLMVVSLCLELRDEPGVEPEGTDLARPAVLGLGAVTLIGLIAYYFKFNGDNAFYHFNQMLVFDRLTQVSGLLIAVCALLAILAGPDELERHRNTRGGEFCALIFSASLGMVMMASAASTMVMFLGLELFSIALYLLCIFFPDSSASRESGMKYFLLSSAASAVLLYGFALLYGATGSTWLVEMSDSGGLGGPLAVVGTGLVLCGLLFKLASVPFHFWAPDVYQGAPTTVTAYMSVATKVAALAALWRMVEYLGAGIAGQLAHLILFSLAILSMLVGNFLALSQKDLKRMLAYSGVANGGYLLIAPIIYQDMQRPMLFFMASYLLGNIGAFLAVAQIEALQSGPAERSSVVGLFHRQPWVAACFAICLVSLAGLPPMAGFMGKFLLFGKAIQAGNLILPVFGIVGSLIGAVYYLGTAISLFSGSAEEPFEGDEPRAEDAPTSTSHAALAICCLGVLVLGVVPGSFLSWL
ncbi:MAG: NADH-quinone oxidoreductase subunit N [Vulcanimicrobiota bacterium]